MDGRLVLEFSDRTPGNAPNGSAGWMGGTCLGVRDALTWLGQLVCHFGRQPAPTAIANTARLARVRNTLCIDRPAAFRSGLHRLFWELCIWVPFILSGDIIGSGAELIHRPTVLFWGPPIPEAE
jgi:hypothetical protein